MVAEVAGRRWRPGVFQGARVGGGKLWVAGEVNWCGWGDIVDEVF